jgi:hypothetical protein
MDIRFKVLKGNARLGKTLYTKEVSQPYTKVTAVVHCPSHLPHVAFHPTASKQTAVEVDGVGGGQLAPRTVKLKLRLQNPPQYTEAGGFGDTLYQYVSMQVEMWQCTSSHDHYVGSATIPLDPSMTLSAGDPLPTWHAVVDPQGNGCGEVLVCAQFALKRPRVEPPPTFHAPRESVKADGEFHFHTREHAHPMNWNRIKGANPSKMRDRSDIQALEMHMEDLLYGDPQFQMMGMELRDGHAKAFGANQLLNQYYLWQRHKTERECREKEDQMGEEERNLHALSRKSSKSESKLTQLRRENDRLDVELDSYRNMATAFQPLLAQRLHVDSESGDVRVDLNTKEGGPPNLVEVTERNEGLLLKQLHALVKGDPEKDRKEREAKERHDEMEKERARQREREKDKTREKEREREREKEREQEREKEREAKREQERERERAQEREKERAQEREKERAKEREQEREREQQRKLQRDEDRRERERVEQEKEAQALRDQEAREKTEQKEREARAEEERVRLEKELEALQKDQDKKKAESDAEAKALKEKEAAEKERREAEEQKLQVSLPPPSLPEAPPPPSAFHHSSILGTPSFLPSFPPGEAAEGGGMEGEGGQRMGTAKESAEGKTAGEGGERGEGGGGSLEKGPRSGGSCIHRKRCNPSGIRRGRRLREGPKS